MSWKVSPAPSEPERYVIYVSTQCADLSSLIENMEAHVLHIDNNSLTAQYVARADARHGARRARRKVRSGWATMRVDFGSLNVSIRSALLDRMRALFPRQDRWRVVWTRTSGGFRLNVR